MNKAAKARGWTLFYGSKAHAGRWSEPAFRRGSTQQGLSEEEIVRRIKQMWLDAEKEAIKGGFTPKPKKHPYSPKGKNLMNRWIQEGLVAKGKGRTQGLSQEEKDLLTAMGFENARTNKAVEKSSSQALMANRFADYEESDPFWPEEFRDIKVGDLIITDNGPRVLKPETVRLRAGAAGGTYSDDNTEAAFDITNEWMQWFTKTTGETPTRDEFRQIVAARIKSRKIQRPTKDNLDRWYAKETEMIARHGDQLRQKYEAAITRVQ